MRNGARSLYTAFPLTHVTSQKQYIKGGVLMSVAIFPRAHVNEHSVVFGFEPCPGIVYLHVPPY